MLAFPVGLARYALWYTSVYSNLIFFSYRLSSKIRTGKLKTHMLHVHANSLCMFYVPLSYRRA